ncbi:MAG: hypothetical protein AMDU4_FER2C00019G0001, partial [Ferroplasma sp. Type II]
MFFCREIGLNQLLLLWKETDPDMNILGHLIILP